MIKGFTEVPRLFCGRLNRLHAHLLHPLSRQQIVSLSQVSCVSPFELTDGRGGRGGGGRGAVSYECKKAWPSINRSILSGAPYRQFQDGGCLSYPSVAADVKPQDWDVRRRRHAAQQVGRQQAQSTHTHYMRIKETVYNTKYI
jgi:hypothetical protein